MKKKDKPLAKLIPVRMEIGGMSHGKPSYRFVDGLQIRQPNGLLLFPYMRIREAKRYCKEQGWAYEEVSN
jgi:hypothetical protein